MNREAVALGTPVRTIFTGELGAVDAKLEEEGLLLPLDDPAGTRALESAKRLRAFRIPAMPHFWSTGSSGR